MEAFQTAPTGKKRLPAHGLRTSVTARFEGLPLRLARGVLARQGAMLPPARIRLEIMQDTHSVTAADIARTFLASIENRTAFDEPYPHFLIKDVLPSSVAEELTSLPFAPPALDGVSGKRELHNDQRSYFDVDAMARFPVMRPVAEALQSREVVSAIQSAFGAPIDDTYLRLEYAVDTDGFWLEPHTDLGVKKFTCLIYLPESDEQETLGTDIYRSASEHWGRSPFTRNTAMIFVPSDKTWHGFVKRKITGLRKSVILNYVTQDWRAREQLSFPDQTVRV
jgi:hypothetical protein